MPQQQQQQPQQQPQPQQQLILPAASPARPKNPLLPAPAVSAPAITLSLAPRTPLPSSSANPINQAALLHTLQQQIQLQNQLPQQNNHNQQSMHAIQFQQIQQLLQQQQQQQQQLQQNQQNQPQTQTQLQAQQIQHLHLIQQALAAQSQSQQPNNNNIIAASAAAAAAQPQQQQPADLNNLHQLQSFLRLQLLLGQQQSAASGQINAGQQNLMRQYQNIQQRLAAFAQVQQQQQQQQQLPQTSPALLQAPLTQQQQQPQQTNQHQLLQQLAQGGRMQNPVSTQLIGAMLLQQQQQQQQQQQGQAPTPQQLQQRQQLLQILQAQIQSQNQSQNSLGLPQASGSVSGPIPTGPAAGNTDSAPNTANAAAQGSQPKQTPQTPQPARENPPQSSPPLPAQNTLQQQQQQQQRTAALVNAALLRGNTALAQQLSAYPRNSAVSPQAAAATTPAESPQTQTVTPALNLAAFSGTSTNVGGAAAATTTSATSPANAASASSSTTPAANGSASTATMNAATASTVNGILANPLLFQQTVLQYTQHLRQIDEALAVPDVTAKAREQMIMMRLRLERELIALRQLLANATANNQQMVMPGGDSSSNGLNGANGGLSASNAAAQLAAAAQLVWNQQAQAQAQQQQHASIIANLARSAAGIGGGGSGGAAVSSAVAAGATALPLLSAPTNAMGMPMSISPPGTNTAFISGSAIPSSSSTNSQLSHLQIKGPPMYQAAPSLSMRVFEQQPMHGLADTSTNKMDETDTSLMQQHGDGFNGANNRSLTPLNAFDLSFGTGDDRSAGRADDNTRGIKSHAALSFDSADYHHKVASGTNSPLPLSKKQKTQQQQQQQPSSALATMFRQALEGPVLQQPPTRASYGRSRDQILDNSLWRRPPELDIPVLFGQQRKRRLQTLISQTEPWSLRCTKNSENTHRNGVDGDNVHGVTRPVTTSAVVDSPVSTKRRTGTTTSFDTLDTDLEDILLSAADNFIEQVTHRACMSAMHRHASKLDVRDIQLELEQNWDLRVPGFVPEKVRGVRRHGLSTGHLSRVAAVQRARRDRQAAVVARMAALQRVVEEGMAAAQAHEDAEAAAEAAKAASESTTAKTDAHDPSGITDMIVVKTESIQAIDSSSASGPSRVTDTELMSVDGNAREASSMPTIPVVHGTVTVDGDSDVVMNGVTLRDKVMVASGRGGASVADGNGVLDIGSSARHGSNGDADADGVRQRNIHRHVTNTDNPSHHATPTDPTPLHVATTTTSKPVSTPSSLSLPPSPSKAKVASLSTVSDTHAASQGVTTLIDTSNRFASPSQ